MNAAVSAHGIHKRFGALDVLKGIDLEVAEGTTYGLLGPSGSGKSTLIRLLLGLSRADAGEVTVRGRPMPDRAILSEVGYMPQAPSLYMDLTARENVAFFAGVQGIRDSAAIDRVLDIVQLRGRADSPLHTFSGGMVNRTSLACALVHGPRLLFLDEPTVGLDPLLRASFWQHFRRLNREGVTIVLTSHLMDEAQNADRLGLIRFGTFLAEGTPAEIVAASGAANLGDAFLTLAEAQG
ncbi:MAG: ABC transporter ATP-binding protein [Chloroflexi bacterium]|nr:ABC transporter ATP-binding protein [Chloroflexota bacterium]